MKILFVLSKYIIKGTGGVEKMCCFLANNFANRGHKVEIATMEDIEGTTTYPLDPRVKLINLFDPKIPQLPLKPVSRYNGRNPIKWIYGKYLRERAKSYNRKICKKLGGKEEGFKYNLRNRASVWNKYINEFSPDVIITMFIDSLHEITFEKTYQAPIIASINVRPDYDDIEIHWHKWRGNAEYLANLYSTLSGAQILFNSYKNFLPKGFSGNVSVIPNPVDRVEAKDIVLHTDKKERFIIMNLGRFVLRHKQQDIAIDVFSKLAKKYPKWDLHLWGTGEDEPILRKKIAKLDLEDRIILKGFTDNPIEKLKTSDIFLFPSKFEGLPLALIEAMSVGLPSVGFDYCMGVNELIEHNKNGFLAKDNIEMQNYLEVLMNDHELRNNFGKQANECMSEYSPEIIADMWEEFVTKIRNENTISTA